MPNPYSATLLAHFRKPRNQGTLRDPTIAQEGTNPLCGDRVKIEMYVEDDVVREARFTANACAICVAAASILTDLVRNAPLDEVETLTVDDLMKSLDAHVPSSRTNCVRLPLTVLHTGIHLFRRRGTPAPGLPPKRRSVAAIVLAAGQARRFGAQKLVAPFGSSTVIRTTVEKILGSSASPLVIVVARDDDAVRSALAGIPAIWAVNEDPVRGMGASVAAGIAALPSDVEAALVALGDQPMVDAAVIDELADVWWTSGRPIAVPRYRGRRGNPVLFDRAVFDDLRRLQGDRGARDFIDANTSRLSMVEVDAPMPIDIDTPADYDALLRSTRQR